MQTLIKTGAFVAVVKEDWLAGDPEVIVSCTHSFCEAPICWTSMRNNKGCLLKLAVFKQWKNGESIVNLIRGHCQVELPPCWWHGDIYGETHVVYTGTVRCWCPRKKHHHDPHINKLQLSKLVLTNLQNFRNSIIVDPLILVDAIVVMIIHVTAFLKKYHQPCMFNHKDEGSLLP